MEAIYLLGISRFNSKNKYHNIFFDFITNLIGLQKKMLQNPQTFRKERSRECKNSHFKDNANCTFFTPISLILSCFWRKIYETLDTATRTRLPPGADYCHRRAAFVHAPCAPVPKRKPERGRKKPNKCERSSTSPRNKPYRVVQKYIAFLFPINDKIQHNCQWKRKNGKFNGNKNYFIFLKIKPKIYLLQN